MPGYFAVAADLSLVSVEPVTSVPMSGGSALARAGGGTTGAARGRVVVRDGGGSEIATWVEEHGTEVSGVSSSGGTLYRVEA